MRTTTIDATERTRGRRGVEDRHRILRRDNGICQRCLKAGRITPATQVDHIEPLHKGGPDSDENKQSLCDPCHAEKTREDMGHKHKATIGVDGWPVDAAHHWNT